MKVSELATFLEMLPNEVRRANPDVTLWVPTLNTEFAIDDADFDAHGKPPVWVTISAQKVKYEREDWEPKDKNKKAS